MTTASHRWTPMPLAAVLAALVAFPLAAQEPPGDDGPRPPDPCAMKARAAAERCLAEGNDPERCRELATRVLDECHACADGCLARADELTARCLAEGVDPEACRERREHFLRGCLDECFGPGEPGCADRCRAAGREAFERCRAAGGDEAECFEVARHVTTGCLRECAIPRPCLESCRERAGAVRDRCLAEGGAEERCDAVAREAMERCLHDCMPNPCGPPPPRRMPGDRGPGPMPGRNAAELGDDAMPPALSAGAPSLRRAD